MIVDLRAEHGRLYLAHRIQFELCMARRHGHLLLNVHRAANRTQLSVRIDLGSLYRLILGVIVDHLSALIERLCCDFIVRIESLIYCHLANCVQHLGVVLVEPYLGGGVA